MTAVKKKPNEDFLKIAKGAGISLLGGAAGKGLFFLSNVLIARFFGAEAFGLFAIGFAVVKISEIMARIGLNIGGMRFVSIYKDSDIPKLKGVLFLSIGICLLNGSVLGYILHISSGIIAEFIFKKPDLSETLQYFSYCLPFIAGVTVVSALLQGFHLLKYTVYTRDVIQNASYILLIIFFYLYGIGLKGAINAYLLSHIIALASGLHFLKKAFPDFTSATIRPQYNFNELISYSYPLLFTGILHYLLSWTDILMIGMLSSAGDVGVYRAASQFTFLMTLFLFAVNSIYAPMSANLYHKKDMEKLREIYKSSTRLIINATFPLFILLVFSSTEVMLIFGKDYVHVGSRILVILSFGQLINCATGGVGYTLSMTGRQRLEALNSLIMVIVNILLNLFLIKKYGSIGAAISTCATVTLINILRLVEVNIIYKMQPFQKEHLRIFVPAIYSIALLTIIGGFIQNLDNYLVLTVNLFVIFSTFYVYKYFIGFDDEEHYLINTIRERLFTKFAK